MSEDRQEVQYKTCGGYTGNGLHLQQRTTWSKVGFFAQVT